MLDTLLTSIAGGMLFVLSLSRTDQIAWKFYRLVGCICLGIAAGLATWWLRESRGSGQLSGALLSAVIVIALTSSIMIFLAPRAELRPQSFRMICALGGVAGIAASCFSMADQFLTPEIQSNRLTRYLLLLVGQWTGSLFLGSITLAWLLGHAYLTATRMTIAPLQRFTRLLNWFVNARLVIFAVSLAVAWWLNTTSGRFSVSNHLSQAWLIATMRIGVGLILVSVLAWMVNDCVRLRSTQSATGILYFASVAAYIGELAGQQLIRECRWPL
ncbi:MAG: hypothetical protein HY287_14175 [Planctomycetes bacterium]|nr:hypothetical protein [Planctomycetota bacterium]MBI3835470.1 hypothetical protein [Planctomycetota bacterium]